MNRRKRIALVIAGILAGIVISSPAAQAVDFAANSSSQAEVSTAQTGDGYLANGKPVTEENVLEILRQIEQNWPQGTVWGTHDTPGTHKNEVPSTAASQITNTYRTSEYYGCSGYAAMVSSLVFGDAANPGRKLDDLSQIRPGDIVVAVSTRDSHGWHVIVALESPNESYAFHYTDGNNGQKIYWPNRQNPYGRENLDCFGEDRDYHLEAWTRYPESISYTGNSVGAWPTGTEK